MQDTTHEVYVIRPSLSLSVQGPWNIACTHVHTHRQLFRQVAHIAKPLKQLSSLESYLFDNNRHGTVGMTVRVFVCESEAVSNDHTEPTCRF